MSYVAKRASLAAYKAGSPRRRAGVEYHKHKPYEPEAAARSASWIFRGAHDPQETPAAAASASSSGIVSGASSQPPSCARPAAPATTNAK